MQPPHIHRTTISAYAFSALRLYPSTPFFHGMYTKSIQNLGNFFGTTFGTRKLFSKKYQQAGSD